MIAKIRALALSSTSKDTFVTLIGNAAVAMGGMLFTVITARALEPEKFGIFSALFAAATLLGSLSDVGISSALVNFLPKLKVDRNVILSLTFWVQIITALFLFLVSIAFIPFKDILFPGSAIVHFFLLAIWVFVMALEAFAESLLRAEKRFTFTSIVMGVSSWFKLAVTFLILVSGFVTITNVLIASIAGSALAAAMGLKNELKNIRPVFPKAQFEEIFHFAKWIALMRSFSVAVSRVDVILLNAIGSSFDAGIFAAASRVSLLFALLVSSLGSVVAPRFSSFNHNSQTKTYLKKVAILISGIGGMMLISILLAPFIINLVYGPEYHQTIPVFQALTLAMIPFLLSVITTNPLIYTFNQPSYVAKLTIIQVVLIVVFDLIFIPKLGPIAPTISLAISNTVVLILSGWKLIKLLR